MGRCIQLLQNTDQNKRIKAWNKKRNETQLFNRNPIFDRGLMCLVEGFFLFFTKINIIRFNLPQNMRGFQSSKGNSIVRTKFKVSFWYYIFKSQLIVIIDHKNTSVLSQIILFIQYIFWMIKFSKSWSAITSALCLVFPAIY